MERQQRRQRHCHTHHISSSFSLFCSSSSFSQMSSTGKIWDTGLEMEFAHFSSLKKQSRGSRIESRSWARGGATPPPHLPRPRHANHLILISALGLSIPGCLNSVPTTQSLLLIPFLPDVILTLPLEGSLGPLAHRFSLMVVSA
jgi:hypothetical protein